MSTSEISLQPNEVPFTKRLRNLQLKNVPKEILASLCRGKGASLAPAPHGRYLPRPRATLTE